MRLVAPIPRAAIVSLCIVLTAALLIFLILNSESSIRPAQRSPQATQVEVIEIVKYPQLNASSMIFGTVRSRRHTTLYSPLNNEVRAIYHHAGDRVKKGSVLLELDSTDQRNALLNAQAQHKALEAQIKQERNRQSFDQDFLKSERQLMTLATRQLEREQRLLAQGSSTEVALEQRISEQESARIRLNSRLQAIANADARMSILQSQRSQSQLNVANAELALKRCIIQAPFDGVLTAVHTAVGSRAHAGASLLTLFDPATLEVEAQIPQNSVPAIEAALAQGQKPVLALVRNAADSLALKLSRIASSVTAGSTSVNGYFQTANGAPSTPALKLGQWLQLELILPAEKNVYLLPDRAIYADQTIYVIQNDRLKAQTIQTLGRVSSTMDRSRTQLLVSAEQLPERTEVLATRLPTAFDGMRVRVTGRDR